MPLIGFHPIIVILMQQVSLIYQFWIHTEAVDKLPRPIEYIFNTPSHHRVHHARNPKYIDRNYAGVLIIWDKLFGSFVEEDAAVPCEYGIVKPVRTHNPVTLTFHEWIAMFRDAARPQSLGARVKQLFGPPEQAHSQAIEPDEPPATSAAQAERA
jgi:sterol desaturase/sphingolipid hydroxylase (fatty acid hydroxylase superfamily)